MLQSEFIASLSNWVFLKIRCKEMPGRFERARAGHCLLDTAGLQHSRTQGSCGGLHQDDVDQTIQQSRYKAWRESLMQNFSRGSNLTQVSSGPSEANSSLLTLCERDTQGISVLGALRGTLILNPVYPFITRQLNLSFVFLRRKRHHLGWKM